MNRSQPFARALEMVAMIQAAMSSINSQDMMAAIGPYISRGKGRGKQFDKQRHGNVCHSAPHQGKKERARRVAQMAQQS